MQNVTLAESGRLHSVQEAAILQVMLFMFMINELTCMGWS